MIVIGTSCIGTIIPEALAHFHTSVIVHAPPGNRQCTFRRCYPLEAKRTESSATVTGRLPAHCLFMHDAVPLTCMQTRIDDDNHPWILHRDLPADELWMTLHLHHPLGFMVQGWHCLPVRDAGNVA